MLSTARAFAVTQRLHHSRGLCCGLEALMLWPWLRPSPGPGCGPEVLHVAKAFTAAQKQPLWC